MAFQKILGSMTPDEAQSDIERIFSRSAHARPGSQARERSARKPRLTPAQIAARRQAEVTRRAEEQRLQAEEARRKEEALAAEAARRAEEKRLLDEQERYRRESPLIVRNPSQPIELRIERAPVAGFIVVRRGPENRPRRIIFVHRETKERICFAFPKGKNARSRLEKDIHHRLAA